MAERGSRIVTYEEWQKIDAHEREKAGPEAPRRKLVTVEDMLGVLA